MISFVHIADLHLDAPFAGVSMAERKERRDELKRALKSVVDYCRDNKTKLLLISGDLFDGEYARQDTVAYASACFAEIPDTRVFIAPGNHDFYGAATPYKYCKFPDNVHIFTSEVLESVELPELDCAVYGFGYNGRRMTENPVCGIRPRNHDRINILLAHGDLDVPSSAYYDIGTRDIFASGLDYVALGHIHEPSGVMRFGDTPCVYSGCLIGKDFGECGKRGMICGSLTKGKLECELIPVTDAFYEEKSVCVSEKQEQEIIDEARAQVSGISEEARVRIRLYGEREALVDMESLNLSAALPKFRLLEVIDDTADKLYYRDILDEYSLRGMFARSLSSYIESDDEATRKKGLLALKYGLDALKK